MRILALPRDPGPFQEELYRPMAERHEVTYLDGPTPSRSLNLLLVPLLLVAARRAGTRVLHVHWVFGFVPGWCSGRRLAIVFRWWFALSLATAHRLGMSIVWTAHNTVPHAPVFDDDEAARRTLVGRCDAIVAPTDAGAAEVRTRFTPTCGVTTIPLPAPRVPAPVRTASQVRAYYGVPREAVLLVFAGKVEPYKGVDDLLEALRLLADDPALPRVELVVAGVRSAAMRTLDDTIGPHMERVHLDLRHLPDLELAELLAAADAVVLPFRHVTTSASVLYAMAAGAACLVPDLPAFADLPDAAILRYPSGPHPVAALAEALRTVVLAGKPLRDCLGRHAALHALTRDPQSAADRYADLYDDLAVRRDTVLLTPWAPAHDGLARHSADLVAALRAQGTTTSVVTPSPGPQASDVVRLRRVTTRRVLAATRRADTVHLQVTVPAWGLGTLALVRACRALRADGARVVVTLHEVTRELALLGPVARRLYRAVAAATDMIVVHTPSARHALLTCGIPDDAVTTIPHGAFGPATPDATGDVIRDPARVLCFGYLHPDKGFERAIDAIADVPGAHLVIAGAVRPRHGLFRAFGRRDHRYAAGLRRRAGSGDTGDTGDLGDSVTFVGSVSDTELDELLASSAVVVLPYRAATQSGVLNRAVAAGAAIVATDLPGLRADLPASAVLVPADDPLCTPALAAALRDLLGDADRLTALRHDVAAQSHLHGPERVVEALTAVYAGLPVTPVEEPAEPASTVESAGDAAQPTQDVVEDIAEAPVEDTADGAATDAGPAEPAEQAEQAEQAEPAEPAEPAAPTVPAGASIRDVFARGVRGTRLAVPAPRHVTTEPTVPAPRHAVPAERPAPESAPEPVESDQRAGSTR